MGSALPLIAIYMYTKFYLKAKSSFKVICRTRYRRTGGWTDIRTKPLWGAQQWRNCVKTESEMEKQLPILIAHYKLVDITLT